MVVKKNHAAHSRKRLVGKRQQQITQLFTKGYLDPAVYAQQTDELLKASARLTAEKDAIIATISGGTKQKEALEDILHYTSGASMMAEFDEDAHDIQIWG